MKEPITDTIVDDMSDLPIVFGMTDKNDSGGVATAPRPAAVRPATATPETDDRTLDEINRRLEEMDALRDLLEETGCHPPQEEDALSAVTTISVVIPVRNMESNLTHLVGRILAAPGHKEIILVDDKSIDCSPIIMRQLKSLPEVTILLKNRQEGFAAAMRDGIRLARGQVVITFNPATGEDPRCFATLARPIVAGECDAVYQSRFNESSKTGRRPSLCDRLISLLTRRTTGRKIRDVRTGCKAFRRETIKNVALSQKGDSFDYEVTAQVVRDGGRIKELMQYGSEEKNCRPATFADVIRALTSYMRVRSW